MIVNSEFYKSFSLSVATAERLFGVRTWGYADLKLATPVTEETLFQIGSVSKSFTALALLQQWDEGRLDLDAPVTRSGTKRRPKSCAS